MTPRLKKAIARTAEFSGQPEDAVADMAAENLEAGIAQAEKVARSTLAKAIKKVHIGGAARARGGRSRRSKTPAQAAAA
jgi:hypothetical protein